MKRLRSLQQRDGLGIGSLLALTGVLYTAGGHVTAAFGLAAAGAWLLGPPVFAFVLGQTGLAVVLTPASPALLAVGEVALLGLLFSDVAVQRRFRRGVWRSSWAGSWEAQPCWRCRLRSHWLRQLF